MSIQGNHPSDSGVDHFCFLVEKEPPWSEVLADVLKQNDIPFYKTGNMGAGLSIHVGPMLERFQFYVPQSHLWEAQSVVDELFSEKGLDN